MRWANASPGHATLEQTEGAEIVANLWYVMNDQGFIYSLRSMLYVVSGSDADKLQFLGSRAYLDYLVAQPFSIPDRYATTFISPQGKGTRLAVIHHDDATAIGGIDKLFFDALDHMQNRIPAQTNLCIPVDPLIRITALLGASNGTVTAIDALEQGNGPA